MTTPEGPEAPNDGNPLAASAAFANAYAIVYRLIGDRDGARRVAVAVADSYHPLEAGDPTGWLPDLAADAVTASLLTDGAAGETRAGGGRPVGDTPAGEQASTDGAPALRTALRRRLSAADAATRTAVGLHLLAGYPQPRVAQLMSRPLEAVEELCAPFAPPPGVSYRDLGDPVLRGVAEPVVRSHRRRVRVPVVPILAVVLVLAVAWWATSVSGPRPTLGRARSEVTARFGPDLDPLPSAGCAATGAAATTTPPGVSAQAVPAPHAAAYRLSTPAAAPDAPASLVLALPGYQQTAEQFQGVANLEAALPGAYVATLEPEAPLLELNSAADPDRRDDVAAATGVVDAVVVAHCVDLRRVHVVGFGPGGQLAGRVACAAPGTFATASMVGGAQLPAGCTLRPAVAALLTANADDPVLPPEGGYGPAAATANPAGTPPRPEADSLADVANRWAADVGAVRSTVDAKADDTIVTDRTGPAGVAVASVLHPAGGHTWGPGDTVAVVDFQQHHARST